jgi:hypothetical protein
VYATHVDVGQHVVKYNCVCFLLHAVFLFGLHSSIKIEAVCFSETSVDFHFITQCCIQEHFQLLFFLFWKKIGLWHYHAVCMSGYSPPPKSTFECLNQSMYNMASVPNSTSYIINPSHQSVYLYVYTLIVARQRLSKYVPATTKNCWRLHFLFGPCPSKESRRLVLPKTYCYY